MSARSKPLDVLCAIASLLSEAHGEGDAVVVKACAAAVLPRLNNERWILSLRLIMASSFDDNECAVAALRLLAAARPLLPRCPWIELGRMVPN